MQVRKDQRISPSIFPALLTHIPLQRFGCIDVLVYNAGAIWWGPVSTTPTKRFLLMQRINPEGLYKTIQTLLPVFSSQNWEGRIIVVSPPIYSRFFRGKTAYAMGKIAMSVMTKGLAMDWAREGRHGMAITSIWPAAAIQSGATKGADERDLRKPVWPPPPFIPSVSSYELIPF